MNFSGTGCGREISGSWTISPEPLAGRSVSGSFYLTQIRFFVYNNLNYGMKSLSVSENDLMELPDTIRGEALTLEQFAKLTDLLCSNTL